MLLSDSALYKSYGYKCDVFSFGVVCYMLLMGCNPLAGKTETQRKMSSNVEIKEEEVVEKYGYCCLVFLRKMLAANPKHRYTA